MSRQAKRKAIKLFTNHMNRIYSASLSIAKEFDRRSIPITTFKIITDKAHLKSSPELDEFNVDFIDKLNKVVDTIFTTGQDYAITNKSDSIPLNYIKQMVKKVNESFTESAKGVV